MIPIKFNVRTPFHGLVNISGFAYTDDAIPGAMLVVHRPLIYGKQDELSKQWVVTDYPSGFGGTYLTCSENKEDEIKEFRNRVIEEMDNHGWETYNEIIKHAYKEHHLTPEDHVNDPKDFPIKK